MCWSLQSRAWGSELFFFLCEWMLFIKRCRDSVLTKFWRTKREDMNRFEDFDTMKSKFELKTTKSLLPRRTFRVRPAPPPQQHGQPLRDASRKSRDKLSFVRFVLGFKRELQNENFWSAGFCSIHFFGWLNSGEFALWVESKLSKCISQPKRPTSPRLWRDLGFQIRIHWCHKHRDQGAHILWKNWSQKSDVCVSGHLFLKVESKFGSQTTRR